MLASMKSKTALYAPVQPRLLYDRKTAALQHSISIRSLDYLIANKRLATPRIGKKVLVPHGELVRFAAANHYDSVIAAA